MQSTTSQPARVARPVRARSRATVVVFVLLGLVQLFCSAVAPFVEGRSPSRLGTHIEAPTERHYVHDEADCSACIARHLAGPAPLPPTPPIVASMVAATPRTTLLPAPDAEHSGPLAARAPPAATTLA